MAPRVQTVLGMARRSNPTCSAPTNTFASTLTATRGWRSTTDSIRGTALAKPERPACRFQPGDWVRTSMHRHNVQVISISFDEIDWKWRVSTAGYSAPADHFMAPDPARGYMVHQECQRGSRSWAETGVYAQPPHSIPPMELPARDLDVGASHWEPLSA